MSLSPRGEGVSLIPSIWRVIVPPLMLSIAAIVLGYFTNYLVFHTSAELFSVLIALTCLTVAATTSQFTKNHFVVFLAVASGWCAGLDFIHLLIYKGMNLLPFEGSNESTQLWISARFIQALAYLSSIYFLRNSWPLCFLNIACGTLISLVLSLIFMGYFPVTYIINQGLTAFKMGCEWLIILILCVAMFQYCRQSVMMGKQLYRYLQLSILMMVFSEFFLSNYADLYGIENYIGHILKIFSYWFIYVALVMTTIREPFTMLAHAASTYDSIPEATLIIQNDGIISQSNIAAGKLAKLEPEALVGLSSHFMFHNALVSVSVCSICSRILKDKTAFVAEIKKSDDIYFECSLTPIFSNTHVHAWVQVIHDISESKRFDAERSRLLHDLTARVKELRCLSVISNLDVTDEFSIKDLLSRAITEILSAFQYPELIGGEIESDWGYFNSGLTSKNTFYNIENKIIVDNVPVGVLKIFYSELVPTIEHLFLDEELELVQTIAKQLGDVIGRILALNKIKHLSYLYEMLSATNHSALHAQNAQALIAAFYDALLKHGAFETLFIAVHKDTTHSFELAYFHGIETEHISVLNTSIIAKNRSISLLIEQFIPGQVIDVSKNGNWIDDPWTQILQQYGIYHGFIMPLFVRQKLVAIVGMYGEVCGIAPHEQKMLLNKIAADVSYALTGTLINEERLSAESNVSISMHRFSEVFELAPIPMQVISMFSKQVESVNGAFEAWLGYSIDEIKQNKFWLQDFFAHSQPPITLDDQWWQIFQAPQVSNTAFSYQELTVYGKDNKAYIARPTALIVDQEIIIAWIDLSDIRLQEKALRESEHKFRTMVEQTIVGVYVRTQQGFSYINPKFSEIIGWSLPELKNKKMSDLVENESIKKDVEANWQKFQRGLQVIDYKLPIKRKDGAAIVLALHGTAITWDNEPAVLVLVEEVSERERNKAKIEQYVKRLEKAIKGTFTAVSHMVELRDPYTAGHEKRVGLIAKAIGEEMGWTAERCDAIELMGLVHDIGKIAIPTEILVKPTRLNVLETQLLRGHVQAGYDILKDIEFDSPVAAVILQHHERMDGSGYPNKLKGNDIIEEARVLAVADVVESMSSHRPYRSALGLDAAMAEIKRGRDSLYDPLVVDALISLIQEKGYRLPGYSDESH